MPASVSIAIRCGCRNDAPFLVLSITIELGRKQSYTYSKLLEQPQTMLRLTKKADYGLMALKYLAEHPGQASLSAKDIAEAYRIPPQLLAKILQQLAREGLLQSHAGMNGGYTLARNPDSITAFEVIRIIDGPLFITSCVTDSGTCDLTNSCTIKEPLARVNESISEVLKKIRISDLVEADPAHTRQGSNLQELVTIQVQPEQVQSENEIQNA